MKEEYMAYFKSLELSDAAIERIETLLGEMSVLCDKNIQDVFITDFFDNENIRRFNSLWVFTDSTITEFKQFMITNNFDFIAKGLPNPWIDISYQAFDMRTSTKDSRMAVNIGWGAKLSAQLVAASNNCEVLVKLLKLHFLVAL